MIQTVTESLIRLMKEKVHTKCVLASSDDVFEVKRLPSILLQGPALKENKLRRCASTHFENNQVDLTTKQSRYPRYYHLDFKLVVTASTEAELLGFQGKLSAFLTDTPEIEIGQFGSLNLTEMEPLGSSRRVNLSNLRQCSGKLRIEDCPIYSGIETSGRLVTDIKIAFSGDVHSEINVKQ